MNILQDAGLSNDPITTIGKENKVDPKSKTQAKADANELQHPKQAVHQHKVEMQQHKRGAPSRCA